MIVLITLFLTMMMYPQPNAMALSTFNLKAVSDAYINSAQPNINFGSAQVLNVQRSPNSVTYLKFNLTKIPIMAQVVEARLILNLTSKSLDSTSQIGVHIVDDYFWDELGITWNNAPKYGAVPIMVNDKVAYKYSEQIWIVTDVIIEALQNGILSLALVSEADTGLDSFGSRDSSQQPILEIIYYLPWTVGITSLARNPQNPTSEDRVKVYVELNSTAEQVYLYFNASTIWEKIEMTPIGDNTYVAVLPRQPSGWVIGYYALASSRMSGEAQSQVESYRVDLPVYYKDLQDDYKTLKSNYDSLDSMYRELGEQYDDLLNNHTELQQMYSELQIGYENVGKLYTSLREQYVGLEGSYNSLSDHLDDVIKSYEALKNEQGSVGMVYNGVEDGSDQIVGNIILAIIVIITAGTLLLALRLWRNKPP